MQQYGEPRARLVHARRARVRTLLLFAVLAATARAQRFPCSCNFRADNGTCAGGGETVKKWPPSSRGGDGTDAMAGCCEWQYYGCRAGARCTSVTDVYCAYGILWSTDTRRCGNKTGRCRTEGEVEYVWKWILYLGLGAVGLFASCIVYFCAIGYRCKNGYLTRSAYNGHQDKERLALLR